MGSSFGRVFRVTTFGESHGPAVGCVVDGCPPRLPITVEEIQLELSRRRPGLPHTSPRPEPDTVEIVSGVHEGLTLGTPILLLVRNQAARSADYAELKDILRPSHADYTYLARYGFRDPRGSGRASGRETVGRVAAGAIAGKLLRRAAGIEVVASVCAVESIEAALDPERLSEAAVYGSPVFCADPAASAAIAERIEAVRAEGDSLGGRILVAARGVPAGLGDPVFDKLHADLARAMLGIPACRGFEIGTGFAASRLRGSEHNDPFVMKGGRVGTATNHSGGVQGGISNGETIWFRVAFKPTSSIGRPQPSITVSGEPVTVTVRGRHDPCIALRVVPVVAAMTRLVLADHWLLGRALRVDL
jgi:chorismate synthase